MIADHFQYWTIPLHIVTRFICSFFDEYKCRYEVDSYIYYRFVIYCMILLTNIIFILRVGCDMNFRENAISLAYKLRSPEDLVNYLQKNRIFITSFNCLACDIVCERVNWKSGTNYFYFRCPNYLLERSIRQSVLFGENFFFKSCLVLMIQSQEWNSSF